MVIARAQGVRTWLLQRVSAVYMAVYLIYFLLSFAAAKPHDFVAWRGFVTAPLMSVTTLLLFAMLLGHAWVGMRDVIMDYLHDFALRFTVLTLLAVGLIAMGLWLLLVLARML
jgi:succinate dehydrogenase / fumarate reductase membrane anchor subunit